MKKILVIALLGYSVIALLGCVGTMNKKDKEITAPAGLEPQAGVRFTDIPVPAGFKLLPEESYAFENTGIRVGLLKYQGKGNADQVLNFYKDQMPMYNWNLLNVIEYGQRLLNFEREQETCVITLLPKGGTVAITVSFGPKSPAAARKSREPVK